MSFILEMNASSSLRCHLITIFIAAITLHLAHPIHTTAVSTLRRLILFGNTSSLSFYKSNTCIGNPFINVLRNKNALNEYGKKHQVFPF